MDDPTMWLGVARDLGIGMLVLVLIMSGRLLPRWWVQKMLADKDAIIDRQQESLDRQAESLETVALTLPQILEYMKTSNHALTSIRDAAEQYDGGDAR